MLEVELAWAASPAADDPALLDRLITWAAEDWPAWRMAALAEREGYRHPEGRPYTPEEMWSIVITPELVG